MCGILAVNGDYRFRSIPESIIERGRDGNGIYEDEHVQLIQTRLQITGKDKIVLPIQYNDYVCLSNGEIYNYKEINNSLSSYEFKYDSDFETVIYAYHYFGKDFYKLLDGQFAILMYNKVTHEIETYFDELRIKGLYYTKYNGSEFWSSNLRGFPSIEFKGIQNTGFGNVSGARFL